MREFRHECKLIYEPDSKTILLGMNIGHADTPEGRMDVIGSGNTVRFILEGSSGHVDLDLKGIANFAYELLTEQVNDNS
jgi:hypothetical protein